MHHSPDALSTERRKSRRTLMARQILGRVGNGEPFAISLVNISRRGFLGSVDETLVEGMVIQLADNPDYAAEIVRVADGMIACRFAHPVDPFALLRSAQTDTPAEPA